MPSNHPAPAERLIVALDLPNPQEAHSLVERLDGVASFFKVGLELYTATGPGFVRELIAAGKKVFLDCKFLDIEGTVRRSARVAADLGVSFLTVHADQKVVRAAVRGAEGTNLKILAVTVLTSMSDADLQEEGFQCSVQELVLRRARRAIEAGCHGIVASGQEAAAIRSLPGGFIIVTPGIRSAGADRHEQQRSTTPQQAIAAGADYLVVGRPIRDAADPRRAAEQIIREISEAAGCR